MNKKIIALAAVCTLTVSSFTGVMADEPIIVTINGTTIPFQDAEPFIDNGHTLVPMRAIFEAFNATIDWDDETKTVTAYDSASAKTIILSIGADSMTVGNDEVELETPAQISNDRTVVPVRAIAESLDCTVDWDSESRTVVIEKEGLIPNLGGYTGAPVIDLTEHWTDCESADELSSLAGFASPVINYPNMVAIAYRLNTDNSVAEVKYQYSMLPATDGEIVTEKHDSGIEVVVRKVSGAYDNITGFQDGLEERTISINGSDNKIYSIQNNSYITFSADNGAYTYGVIVKADNLSPAEKVDLVENIVRTIAQ